MFKVKGVPLYGFKYGIYINEGGERTPSKWKPAVKIADDNLGDGCEGLVVYHPGETTALIAFEHDAKDGVCMSVISHEVCHLAFFICGAFGITVREGEDNEAYCYIISHLTKEIIKELTR